MAKKITSIASPGGEIGQYLDLERFISMVDELNIFDVASITQDDVDAANIPHKHVYPVLIKNEVDLIEKKTARFANLANQKVHEYLKSRETLTRKKDARNSKRKIDFLKEIDETGSRFRELVSKAQIAISEDAELEEISAQLEAVPHIVNELRKAQNDVDLGLDGPYAGEFSELRHELVLAVHALYSDITELHDWVSRIPDSSEYTNPFFKLLRLCYQAIGEDLSDRTIEDDITKARKLEDDIKKARELR